MNQVDEGRTIYLDDNRQAEFGWRIDSDGHLVIWVDPAMQAEIREQLQAAKENYIIYTRLSEAIASAQWTDNPILRIWKRKRDHIGMYKLPSVVTRRLEQDILDPLVSNGFSYVNPEDIGALTDATILSDGTYNDDGSFPDGPDINFWSDIEFYQIESFVDVLARNGSVTFRKAN